MANVTDILIKTKTTTPEVSSTSEKESVKEQPSLFDSLLKESFSKEETLQEKVEPNKLELNKEKKSVTQSELKVDTKEADIELKTTSNTSLLDRLIIEAKNEVIEDGAKIVIEDALAKSSTEETLNLENNDEVKNKDIKIQSDSTVEIPLEIIDSENQEVPENLENKNDTTTKTDNLENPKTEIKNPSLPILENDTTNLESNGEIKKDLEVILKDNLVTPESEIDIKKDIEIVLDKVLTKENELENSQNIDKEIKVSDNKIEINNLENKIQDGKVIDTILTETLEIKIDDNKVEKKESLNGIDTKNIDTLVENSLPLVGNEVETIDINENITAIDNVLENENSTNQVVSKDIINPLNKPEEKKSLMDILIQKNMEKANIKVLDETGTELLKNEINNKEVISNIYLSEQKNLLNNQVLFNKGEAISLLKDGTSVKDIEKSANILDLGLENLDVEQNVEIENLAVKKQDVNTLDKKNILDSLLNEKNIRSEDIRNLITKSVDASAALLENTLNVSDDTLINVNSPLSYNIQSKIIGAKQQMATMMSDIARQMYENYKPPVTVFRINLNPVDLGNIAILMKNDKNNGLSISMNISNPTTLDALIDNQNVLRNSLNKTFDENTKFNLDFSSSNQNDNQSSNSQSNQNQGRRFERQMDTQSVLQLKEENKNREENIDYM
ncbi:flagellar hook-length control protein FliK [Arcobacter ellisii]|uniref:Flagellar hook-length control protein FliK n=1 Tax=Arcobacter ellisii TaxID=913109 RepID=A0A347UAU6_9BACT|nr:flagellar hook-length control protein FliK [Arcobacter ellisii]AXX95974.1 flagellar hook-length control protein FliK [Arcobacter ellisii]RXI29349.1 flagellar hook-length control protein FliK [Arcobacter ellisii]